LWAQAYSIVALYDMGDGRCGFTLIVAFYSARAYVLYHAAAGWNVARVPWKMLKTAGPVGELVLGVL